MVTVIIEKDTNASLDEISEVLNGSAFRVVRAVGGALVERLPREAPSFTAGMYGQFSRYSRYDPNGTGMPEIDEDGRVIRPRRQGGPGAYDHATNCYLVINNALDAGNLAELQDFIVNTMLPGMQPAQPPVISVTLKEV